LTVYHSEVSIKCPVYPDPDILLCGYTYSIRILIISDSDLILVGLAQVLAAAHAVQILILKKKYGLHVRVLIKHLPPEGAKRPLELGFILNPPPWQAAASEARSAGNGGSRRSEAEGGLHWRSKRHEVCHFEPTLER